MFMRMLQPDNHAQVPAFWRHDPQTTRTEPIEIAGITSLTIRVPVQLPGLALCSGTRDRVMRNSEEGFTQAFTLHFSWARADVTCFEDLNLTVRQESGGRS